MQNVVTMFVVGLQRRTSSTRCSDADAKTSKLQSCSNVSLVLNSKFMSKYIMNVVLTALLQR